MNQLTFGITTLSLSFLICKVGILFGTTHRVVKYLLRLHELGAGHTHTQNRSHGLCPQGTWSLDAEGLYKQTEIEVRMKVQL